MSLLWYEEDMLSSLPDSILCHILSFLPTKQSAATSILSKRWNSLWLSVFTLDLVANNLSDTETFDTVILLRDIKVPIQTLRLKCNFRVNGHDGHELNIPYCRNHINSLIRAATQRGLETLELDMQLSPLVLKLDSTIFNPKTLTVFKLRHVSILMKDLTGKNTSLKTLHLDHVSFRCHRHIIDFLLCFPNLEELQTNVVVVEDKVFPEKLVIKCLPNLMRASISDSETIPLSLLSRALILSIKLTSTYLMQIEHPWFQVPTFHNLTQIELFIEFDCKKKWRWMLEMLQRSPKLQHLIINEKMENGDCEDNWENPAIVPGCLSSHLRTCLIRDCRGRKSELQFIEYVMWNSKVLRTMKIHSSNSISLIEKFLISDKLSMCPRSCKLVFD